MTCDNCGDPVRAARTRALPGVRVCVTCAREIERRDARGLRAELVERAGVLSRVREERDAAEPQTERAK